MPTPEFAPGLPKKDHLGEHTNLPHGAATLVVQEHNAERAGLHFDVRVGTADHGLFSWATKHTLPKPGETIAVYRQPLHTFEYKNFEGKIEEGYGRGTVKKNVDAPILVTKITPDRLHFSKIDKKHTERFMLVKPKNNENDRLWYLLNTTPTKKLEFGKGDYKSVAPKDLKDITPGMFVQPKVDGASALVVLKEDKMEVYSTRVSKVTGHPIVHTEKILSEGHRIDVPKHLVGTVLRGEVYGVDKDGKVLHVKDLSGILNSSTHKALQTLKEKDIKLKTMLFDIHQVGKTPVSAPYGARLDLLKQVVPSLPSNQFHIAETVTSSADAKKLLEDIKNKRHPLTSEGVVIHHHVYKPMKVKLVEEHDVEITKIFPGEGKYKNSAGGFEYKLNEGHGVGRVGTGFTDEERRDMWEHPEDWVGRVAKVHAQEVLPSGMLRAPSYITLHTDK